MQNLYAPEMRPESSRALTRTKAGLLIGSAYLRPAPYATSDAERLQRALLGKLTPRRRNVIPTCSPLWLRWLRRLCGR